MKIDQNAKTGAFTVDLDKKDLQDAEAIVQMMKMPGWKILMDYMNVARELILTTGKSGIRTKDKSVLSAERWGILAGFDTAKTLANNIVERAIDFVETQQEAEKEKESEIYEEQEQDGPEL